MDEVDALKDGNKLTKKQLILYYQYISSEKNLIDSINQTCFQDDKGESLRK